jgi:hypothetical protein
MLDTQGENMWVAATAVTHITKQWLVSGDTVEPG